MDAKMVARLVDMPVVSLARRLVVLSVVYSAAAKAAC